MLIYLQTKYGPRLTGHLEIRNGLTYYVQKMDKKSKCFSVAYGVLDKIRKANTWEFQVQDGDSVKVYAISAQDGMEGVRMYDTLANSFIAVPISKCQLQGCLI